jgi:hypothetical protein
MMIPILADAVDSESGTKMYWKYNIGLGL